jgi:hypothetical protein
VTIRSRRGSALILVLLMTLAVAALAIAAIFMSSSAGLLSRFYDRERDFRLAAESAVAITQSRLEHDVALAIPDTGMVTLASGLKITPDARVSVNVYGAVTGDTSGLTTPHVTLIAQAFDASGVRHVRRVDLRRQSFSQYQMLVDSFPSGTTFGPARVAGPVHTNDVWRSGTTAATAGVYLDRLTATGGFTGTATYSGDTSSTIPRIAYPRDSTYAWMTTLAANANLSFAPVSGNGVGWVRGSRLEFVAFDADEDGVVEVDEGFARVFDLESGVDTSRLRVSVEPSTWFVLYWAHPWNSDVVQNQCGAFYYRGSRWQFFPIAVHRTTWGRAIIQQQGGSNFPSISNGAMNGMDSYDYASTSTILNQTTARCFPAGSPYLMPTERKTNAAGVVTGTAADTVPWGVAAGTGTHGGMDTTFTPQSRSCLINTTAVSSDGRCVAGTLFTLGAWRSFGGTMVGGIAASVRQAVELPYLWPYTVLRNASSRGVMRSTGGPLFVSGTFTGHVTLVVDGDVRILEDLVAVNSPADPSTASCTDQLGIVATADILVADNALVRARRIGNTVFSSMTKHIGAGRDVSVHAHLMSLQGTVGTENESSTAASGLECPPTGGASNSAGGCFLHSGAAVMQRYTPLWTANNTGMRYAGTLDACQRTDTRPPFFPLTNRYTWSRSLEIRNSLANTPTKVRSILMQLKGKTL